MTTSHARIRGTTSPVHWVTVFAAFGLVLGCSHLEGSIENMPPQSLMLVTGSYEIGGRVVDAITRVPIEGAEISTGKSAFQTTRTDSLGVFRLKLRGYSQQMKVRQLFISKKGYETEMLVFSGTDAGTIILRRSVK
ncbi:MAG: hypothetical protein BMS9Abin05_0974 [Rhodothermia bacterium]|nr:MAG: hypothetical protein BMS9Abin05_0974 [Rhodothermia bacterium]